MDVIKYAIEFRNEYLAAKCDGGKKPRILILEVLPLSLPKGDFLEKVTALTNAERLMSTSRSILLTELKSSALVVRTGNV